MKLIAPIKFIIKYAINYKVPGKYAKIRKNDIFLISYPKSGNTWLRFLFGNLLYSNGVNFKNINALIPDIHLSTKRQIDKLKSPRIIKTHEPVVEKYSKAVYIYRDPRDVVISFYYWTKKFSKTRYDSFDVFFDDFISGNIEFGLWSEHVEIWKTAEMKNPDKVLTLRYEDLKADTFNEFKKILEFCNITSSDDEIINAVKLSDFKTMKKLEEKQEKDSFLKNTDLSIKFVRSGQSEWKKILRDEQIIALNNIFGKLMREFPE